MEADEFFDFSKECQLVLKYALLTQVEDHVTDQVVNLWIMLANIENARLASFMR